MTDDEFYRELFEANRLLIQNYFKNKLASCNKQLEGLYIGLNNNFRGFRQK